MICKHCRSKIPIEADFCPICDRPINKKQNKDKKKGKYYDVRRSEKKRGELS